MTVSRARRLQAFGVGAMLLAVAALALAFWSSDRAAGIQGPVSLVGTGQGREAVLTLH